MLLMFQRAETTERKAKDNRQEVVRKSDKKNPSIKRGKIVGLSTVNLARYPQRQLDILFYYGVIST